MDSKRYAAKKSNELDALIRAKMVLTRAINCADRMIDAGINPRAVSDKELLKVRGMGEMTLHVIKSAMLGYAGKDE
jgi:DNA-directed RNA polymerase alpha subunit